MLVHFYSKDNQNLAHLTSMLFPSQINFNNYQIRTQMQYMGKSGVMMIFYVTWFM